jgi:hypothetical protein
MGCNVLKPLSEKIYLVGSFSGLYLWNIENGVVADYFTQQPYIEPEGMQSPIGANMAAGLIEGKGILFWFDYNHGAQRMSSIEKMTSFDFPKMPDNIRKASPMSLWNAALEMHTGRIFEKWIGMFYILIVPLAGICILLVLISGFFLWWKLYRTKRKTP